MLDRLTPTRFDAAAPPRGRAAAAAWLDRQALRGPLTVSVVWLAALLGFDAGGFDLPLARLFGGADGFALRSHWLLTTVLHEGGRLVAWALVLALCIGVWWPRGPLHRLPPGRRLQLAVGTLAAVLAVSALKSLSTTSCPQELAMFGRTAQYMSHWHWPPGLSDGGTGHCFPAGHASAGFAFIAGWFACRRHDRRQAWAWLGGALLAGTLLGLGQQMRGAHFMSHTLWSAYVCWCVALATDLLFQRLRVRQPLAAPTESA